MLTQDGRVARQLIGESSGIEKEYLVRVQYGTTQTDVQRAFPPEQLARWLPDKPEPFFDKGLQSRPDLYQGFARLHMYLDQPEPDALLAESQLLALLGELLHLAPERHALADPQIRFLRDYLLGQLDGHHSLEDLAALFGLDRFAFLRQFKKKTGMTP